MESLDSLVEAVVRDEGFEAAELTLEDMIWECETYIDQLGGEGSSLAAPEVEQRDLLRWKLQQIQQGT